MTHRINGNLNDPNIRKLFESKNFVFLSSIMKDGCPQVTPMWVDIENGYILVNTSIGTLKQKNISRDSRVGLAIADQNNPYHMVTIRGAVVEQIKLLQFGLKNTLTSWQKSILKKINILIEFRDKKGSY